MAGFKSCWVTDKRVTDKRVTDKEEKKLLSRIKWSILGKIYSFRKNVSVSYFFSINELFADVRNLHFLDLLICFLGSSCESCNGPRLPPVQLVKHQESGSLCLLQIIDLDLMRFVRVLEEWWAKDLCCGNQLGSNWK